MEIILASNSPRRQELFKYITNQFKVVVSHVDETYEESLTPEQIVLYLSHLKAKEISQDYPDDIVIGCDTIVCQDGKVLEKPRDEAHAFEMLKHLSNKTHQVLTGVTIIKEKRVDSFYSTTDVTFYPISDKEISDYIKTKEPFDKAGAYGIQGYASKFVKKIKGDYFTVVGLPVGQLYQRIKKITNGI